MAEHASRRRQLMRMIGPEGVAIVPAAPQRPRNGDTFYPYRQDSDFLYLTGFSEPEAVLVLAPEREQGETLLFCRERNPERERWDGARAGLDGARTQYGADDSFPIADVDDILPGLMEGRERIYYAVGRDPAFDQRVVGWRDRLRVQRRSAQAPEDFVSLEHLLHDMRLFKSRAELSCMRRAARVSAAAHVRAMEAARPGMNEREIQAELEYEFRRRGGVPAYLPIVAGGRNACVLHYISNDQDLAEGDLLLVDAGCEIDGYAADITRTFPVSGRFSPAQRDVYDMVLAAQRDAIDRVRPGRQWLDMHDAAVRTLTRGLVDLDLLDGDVDGLIEQGAYRRFYMHKTGHWLGLDVHDVGDYQVDSHSRMLEKNMVMTVEPGLYIDAGDDVPEALRGIGIRIEDDVAVTEGAPDILSRDVPTDPDEIQARMGS